MKKVLVDTDILINFLRGREAARKYLSSLFEDSEIYCSVITVAEIHAGMKEHEREKTTELIDSLNIADINREIAEKAGKYKRDEKRQALELDDCFIAATAFIKEAIFATGNEKHYPMKDIQKETYKQESDDR
jgi:predicted nucleic acid-binding protein